MPELYLHIYDIGKHILGAGGKRKQEHEKEDRNSSQDLQPTDFQSTSHTDILSTVLITALS